MATPKKTAAKKVDPWAEVKPVKGTTTPEKVAATAEDEGSPFGSTTKVMQCIQGFRKHIVTTPIPMNGRATAPDGTVYGYYMSNDVLSVAIDYCESHGAFLDIGTYTNDNGQNIMRLSLIDLKTSDEKVVELNLGTVTNTSELGSRITYAPKYLVALMFGISVQTDSDAFNNGKTKTNEPGQHAPVANPAVYPGSSSPIPLGDEVTNVGSGSTVPASDNRGDNPVASNRSSERQAGTGPAVEHSQSYPVAKQFIERALSIDMLNTAQTKVMNAKQLFDHERVELTEMINAKRIALS